MARASLAAIVLTVAAAAVPSAQQGFGTGRILLALVTDARNRPIVDLDVTDFVVSQGGARAEVLAARVADYPLVVLIDDAPGASSDLPALRSAVGRLVARVGERAIAVLTLNNPPAVIASFDEPRTTILERIEALSVAPDAGRAPLQALARAATMLRETETPFSAIVVVSAAPLETPQEEPPGFLAAFFESRAVLHVVRKGAALSPGGLPPSRYEALLSELANRTGGQHSVIYTGASFQIALDQLADRLASEMMVEYLVPQEKENDRDVRVGVTLPGARVRGLGVSR
jgi:hypothetical protein